MAVAFALFVFFFFLLLLSSHADLFVPLFLFLSLFLCLCFSFSLFIWQCKSPVELPLCTRTPTQLLMKRSNTTRWGEQTSLLFRLNPILHQKNHDLFRSGFYSPLSVLCAKTWRMNWVPINHQHLKSSSKITKEKHFRDCYQPAVNLWQVK